MSAFATKLHDGEYVTEIDEEALEELEAEPAYVPPLTIEHLQRGHACHFYCNAPDVQDLRVDIMSKMRGCESFDKLWKRRKTVRLKGGKAIDIMGLEDLAQSKKTQRDKDWLMLKQLVDNDIMLNKNKPAKEKIRWWLHECRSAELLVDLSKKYSVIAKECAKTRPLLKSAISKDVQKLNLKLIEEELEERRKDVEYWKPLRKELEALRHSAKK